MEEKVTMPTIAEDALPSSQEPTTAEPTAENTEVSGIKLKFNKEIREVPISEAVNLAQKGMKYDKISPDIQKLRSLAEKNGQSISEYISELEKQQLDLHREKLIEECGGNSEIAERILKLEGNENSDTDAQFLLLQKEFPEIESMDSLPEEVLESVEIFGGNLLSAYLLYNHREQLKALKAQQKMNENANITLGSKERFAPTQLGGMQEFIKGIWN